MIPFRYPQIKHKRTQSPGHLAPYKKYKPFLRLEFEAKCVYCRTPDTFKKSTFGVDHYRPQKDFPGLINAYDNLYYCCNECNYYKGARWRLKGFETTRFIPNPCEHVMFQHMKYEAETVVPKSEAGEYAVSVLDLNDPETKEQRALMLHLIGTLQKSISDLSVQILAMEKIIEAADNSVNAVNAWTELVNQRVKDQRALADICGQI